MFNFKISVNGRDVTGTSNIKQCKTYRNADGELISEYKDNVIDEQECQVVTKEIEEGNE